MTYTMSVTIAGLFLLVPDGECSAVRVLFPKGKEHGGGGGHDSMPAHNVTLVYEEERGLPPVAMTGFDLELSQLSPSAKLPGFPTEVFLLRDSRGSIPGDRVKARCGVADSYLRGRISLSGGCFEVLATSDFRMPDDGSVKPLAGIIRWTTSADGDEFPGASLHSLTGAGHASLPALRPRAADNTVHIGVVYADARYVVRHLREITDYGGNYVVEHIHALYDVVDGVVGPVIPVPVPGANPLMAKEQSAFWPTRCVGAHTL